MISETIAEYINKRGIKQVFLCEKTGLSKGSISAALNGKRRLTVEEYASICEALSVPYDFFLKNTRNGGHNDSGESP